MLNGHREGIASHRWKWKKKKWERALRRIYRKWTLSGQRRKWVLFERKALGKRSRMGAVGWRPL